MPSDGSWKSVKLLNPLRICVFTSAVMVMPLSLKPPILYFPPLLERPKATLPPSHVFDRSPAPDDCAGRLRSVNLSWSYVTIHIPDWQIAMGDLDERAHRMRPDVVLGLIVIAGSVGCQHDVLHTHQGVVWGSAVLLPGHQARRRRSNSSRNARIIATSSMIGPLAVFTNTVCGRILFNCALPTR